MKNKKIRSILFCLLSLTEIHAQTFHGDLTLASQSAVDNFSYRSVTGTLTIYDGSTRSITNLDGMSELVHAGGLAIYNNYSLTNLDGLSGLTSVAGTLSISSNPALTNLQGLSNLGFVGETLAILDNNAVINTGGLQHVTYVGGDLYIRGQAISDVNGLSGIVVVGNTLRIRDNPVLVNIDGLSGLKAARSLLIEGNNSLTHVDGLSNLVHVESNLAIRSNTSLVGFCGLYGLLYNNGLGGGFDVRSNAFNPTAQQIKDSGNCTSQNQPPVAVCHNLTISAGVNCQANVSAEQFDNGSFDPDGDNIIFSVSPAGPYPLGNTQVTLAVSDGKQTVSCNALITVVDQSAPAINVVSQPIVLSPPNLQFETIDMSECVVSVSDSCSDVSINDVHIVSVSSDEGQGLSTDIIIAPDCRSVRLRRERNGILFGNGRVYTITLSVLDENGNAGIANCKATVPFGNNPAVDDGPVYTVNSACHSSLRKSENVQVKTDVNKKPGSPTMELPGEFKLFQNYPNPFSQNTIIRWQLPVTSRVSLQVFDLLGNQVAMLVNDNRKAGYYETSLDGSSLPAGTYVCRFIAGDYVLTKKMIHFKQ